MTQWHLHSKRKISGGKRRTNRRSDKRLAWKGGEFSATGIAEDEKKEKRKTVKTLGGNSKVKALKVKFVSVTDPETKKTSRAELVSVLENNANRQYTRQNVITKNALVKAMLAGKEEKVRITSRPGQSGTVQGVLVK